MASGPASLRDRVRELFALERDVLVLSVAMFAFSLGFQMTSRYLGEYMVALGTSAFVVGLYGTFSNVISAVYSLRRHALGSVGSRYALVPTDGSSTGVSPRTPRTPRRTPRSSQPPPIR